MLSGFGAQITLEKRGDQVMAVTVAIKREKSRELDTKAQLFFSRKLVVRDELREFAGLCSWVGSIVPVVKPFSLMLWAAVAAPPATGETSSKITSARVKLQLSWFVELSPKRVSHSKPAIPSPPIDGRVHTCLRRVSHRRWRHSARFQRMSQIPDDALVRL